MLSLEHIFNFLNPFNTVLQMVHFTSSYVLVAVIQFDCLEVLLNPIWIYIKIIAKYTAFGNTYFPKRHRMPTNKKICKVRKQGGKTDIGMGIHCEAPTPTLFYFSFHHSLPVSQQFLLLYSK